MRILRTLIALALILALNQPALPQGAGIIGQGKSQFFTDSGAVLASGWVCSYVTGSTTPQNTYTDSTATITKVVPWQLDTAGRGEIWLKSGLTYRLALYRAGTGSTCNGQTVGALVWQVDGISALPPATAGLTFHGTIQMDAGKKIAWGASGTFPYVMEDSGFLRLVGGSNGFILFNTAETFANLAINNSGNASFRNIINLGSPGAADGKITFYNSHGTGSITLQAANNITGDRNFNVPLTTSSYGQPMLGAGNTFDSFWNPSYYVASDFTTAANTNLQTITGLSWATPQSIGTSITQPFTCYLNYSIATAAVAVAFGLQSDAVAPTNLQGWGMIATSTTAATYGNATITNTTATSVVSATPSATATVYNATISGYLDFPNTNTANNIKVMVSTANSADLVTVKRGSFCRTF
jgi:hypothetical protein